MQILFLFVFKFLNGIAWVYQVPPLQGVHQMDEPIFTHFIIPS